MSRNYVDLYVRLILCNIKHCNVETRPFCFKNLTKTTWHDVSRLEASQITTLCTLIYLYCTGISQYFQAYEIGDWETCHTFWQTPVWSVIGKQGIYFVRHQSNSPHRYSEADIEGTCMLGFVVDNIYVVLGDQVFQQSVGIPTRTNCAHL
jgi:hypothetical protein